MAINVVFTDGTSLTRRERLHWTDLRLSRGRMLTLI